MSLHTIPLSAWVLAAVLILITLRQLLPGKIAIWQIMLGGGIVVLITGSIHPLAAWKSIDWNVMGYLLGVFYVGQALEESHYLELQCHKLLMRKQSASIWLLWIVFGGGLLSAVLLNDTVAVILTPLVLALSRQLKLSPAPFLLALAYAVTIGSVMSPIGNPQNLMIATHSSVTQPFAMFFGGLWLPTLLNLGLCFAWLYLIYHRSWGKQSAAVETKTLSLDAREAALTKLSCLSLAGLLLLKILLMGLHSAWQLSFVMVALTATLPHLIFSKQRLEVAKGLDWGTLYFFIGMFILMASVWQTGILQHLFSSWHLAMQQPSVIMSFSAALSQLISNVPCVALYLPYLQHLGHLHPDQLRALAVGSTMAGNFFVFGAASNIIVIQQAERKGMQAFSFAQHCLWGIPLSLVNLAVYYYL